MLSSKLAIGFRSGVGTLKYMNKLYATVNGQSAPRALVPVAQGTEEIEAVTIIDTLVRAGVEVRVATVETSGMQVTCSRGVKLVADTHINDCANDAWDLIACPGGMPGAERLRDSITLSSLLQKQHSEGKLVAAICAAPAVIFSPLGFTTGIKATSYPADKFKAMIENYTTDRVVVASNVITSQGPGTALEFSLKLVELLRGVEMADSLKNEMLG